MAESRIEVSAIIPAFNRHETLPKAVESALNQNISCFEVVVVDDGSDPPIAAAGALNDPRVRIIRNDLNRGAAAARNIGIAAAQGQIVAFLDSDDTWRPSKLQEQICLLAHTDLHAVVTGFALTDTFRSKFMEVIPYQPNHLSDFAAGCWCSPGTTLLTRKATFEQIGLFSETLRRLEDYEWFLRFALMGGKLAVIPKVLADVNVSAGGRPDEVRAAACAIRRQYTRHLGQDAKRNLKSFVAMTEASAYARAGLLSKIAMPLMRSFFASPRVRLHRPARRSRTIIGASLKLSALVCGATGL